MPPLVREALDKILSDFSEMLQEYVWLVPVFVLIAAFSFCLERGLRGLSTKDALKAAFPPEYYRHPATRFDMINAGLKLVLWSPLATAAGALVAATAFYELLVSRWGQGAPLDGVPASV